MVRLIPPTASTIAPERQTSDLTAGQGEWMVVVYDNDVNTYEQVMHILMLATACTEEEAYIEAWEIDHFGRSIVHYASEDECHRVAGVISTIGIRVEVAQEP